MTMTERKVETEITIAATPEEVWRAISEGEEIKRWFTVDARVNPGPGGSIWMSFGEGMDWESPIEIWEPNRHLRASAVDYFIEARGEGETVLRIVQSGFGAEGWEDELDNLNAGWRAFAATLRHYLEKHRGKPRTFVYFRHPPVALPRSEVFAKLLRAVDVPLVAAGERFEGELFRGAADVAAPPINFSGPLENYGNGFVFIEVEPGREKHRPAVWVSLYGESGAQGAALQEELRERLTRAFGE